jgi:hypothetical protein
MTAAEACAALAQAECTKRMTCSNGNNITRVYGEMGVCVTRGTLSCTNALASPGNGNDPTVVAACTAAYATLACNDFFDGKLPAPCTPTGSVATGGACTFNGQCMTGYCGDTKNKLCGTCAAVPAAGDSCATGQCGHGQTCVDATMLCQNNGLLNGSCDANDPCGNGLSCVGNSAATGPGTCQLALGQLGVACGGVTMPGCDNTLGLYCGGAAGAKTCMMMMYVGDGEACGNLGSGVVAQCSAGNCYDSNGQVTGSGMGTCKLDAVDGASCDTMMGPSCMTPARCVISGGGTSGTCRVPMGNSCG